MTFVRTILAFRILLQGGRALELLKDFNLLIGFQSMWTLLFVLLHCRLCTEEENLLLEWEKKEQKSLGNS